MSLAKPAGAAAGDALIASFTTDLNPSVTAVPTGWTAIVNVLSINSSSSFGARVFVYHHVVGSADPSSYAWDLGTAVKWGGGITAFCGVNQSTPLDSTVVTAVDTTYTATGITLASITAASNGAMLIGGVGFDSSSPAATRHRRLDVHGRQGIRCLAHSAETCQLTKVPAGHRRSGTASGGGRAAAHCSPGCG